MKKILVILAGGIGVLFLIVFAVVVRIQTASADEVSAGGVYIEQFTQSDLAVTGIMYGPGTGSGNCPNAQPFDYGTYNVDGGNSTEFTLTQTVEGTDGCTSLAQAELYQYTYSFSDSALASSLSAGAHTLNICGEPGDVCASTSFTVGGGGGAQTGLVNVMSEDSQTGSAVTSSWDLLEGATDLCGNQSCTAQSQTFNNVSLGVTDTVVASSTSADGFAFGGTREEPLIARNGNDALNGFFALSQNLFVGVADALTYCGYMDSSSNQCALPYTLPPLDSLTPTASYPTANFIILWDPEATMSVTPALASATLSSSGTIQTVTISNTSDAPGSELGWTANVTCAGVAGNCPNNADWLSITPFANADPNGITSSSPETATIAYTGGLSPGTYQANVIFNGTSISGGSLTQPPAVSVTLTVTNTGGAYFACGLGVCEATSTPGAISCAAACGGSTLKATCSPASISLDQTTQCELDLNGVKQDAAWTVVSGSAGSIGPSSGVYTPSAAGTESVSGLLPDGASAQATITVTSLPACNGAANCQAVCTNPSLTATPSSIVVPESSNLSYGCSHVTECQLTGGDLPGFPVYAPPGSDSISGSAPTTPSITTTYALTCVNGNYSSDSTSTSIQVTVGGASRCEQNPNGAGCQGQ